MVFNGGMLFWTVFLLFSIWLCLLSVFLFRTIGHYNRLTAGITKSGLKDILESILQKQIDAQKQITAIGNAASQLALDGKKHVQKMSVVRFNPFADTGGSQSFSMAILDGDENGFVMTSLFARNGHRWYIKEVTRGREKDFELSKEEETAIKKAKIS